MAESENINVALQGYENFKTGSISSLLDQMAEDVDWQLPEIEGVPLGGKRSGRASVAEFFSRVARDQEAIQFDPREFIAQGHKVISLGHYKWRVRETGREFESDFVHVFTIREGKIAAFQEHFDTAAAAAAYQKTMTA